MLGDTCFRNMVHAIRNTTRVPDKKCCSTMCDIKKNMMVKVSSMLNGEHMCTTTDGWTSCANDTYMSLTISLITRAWQLVALSLDCSKSAGTTPGDALADGVKVAVAKHSLNGKVTDYH